MLEGWKQRARELKREVYALYFACRDPRVAWYAKALAVGTRRCWFLLADCRQQAIQMEGTPRNWIAAGVIVAIWVAIAVAGFYWLT